MASGGQLIIQLVLHRDHCVPIVPVMEDWSFRGGQWEFSWMGEEQVDQGWRFQESLGPPPSISYGGFRRETKVRLSFWWQKSEVRVSPMVTEGLCGCQAVILGLLAQEPSVFSTIEASLLDSELWALGVGQSSLPVQTLPGTLQLGSGSSLQEVPACGMQS